MVVILAWTVFISLWEENLFPHIFRLFFSFLYPFISLPFFFLLILWFIPAHFFLSYISCKWASWEKVRRSTLTSRNSRLNTKAARREKRNCLTCKFPPFFSKNMLSIKEIEMNPISWHFSSRKKNVISSWYNEKKGITCLLVVFCFSQSQACCWNIQ